MTTAQKDCSRCHGTGRLHYKSASLYGGDVVESCPCVAPSALPLTEDRLAEIRRRADEVYPSPTSATGAALRDLIAEVVRLREQPTRADYDRMQRVMTDAAFALCFGIEGSIPPERAIGDAFTALYGPDEAIRILDEGAR